MKKTILHNNHKLLNARFVDFSGWEMPIQYTGIICEHMAVRNYVGLFDTCHMGEISLSGQDAQKTLQNLIPRDVKKFKHGKCYYTHFCDNSGNIIDDTVIYKKADNDFFIVVNSVTAVTDYEWINKNIKGNSIVTNLSDKTGKIDVQGPLSRDLINIFLENDKNVNDLKFYNFSEYNWQNNSLIISRTGYTGSLGFEIYCPIDKTQEIWEVLLEKGKEFSVMPAGLGARDTLRLEAGFPLMGQDMYKGLTLIEVGFESLVSWEKGDFIGRQALLDSLENVNRKYRLSFSIQKGGIARPGYEVYDMDRNLIGKVTSGTFSPCLKKAIGFVVFSKKIDIDDVFLIKIRDKFVQGKVESPPFI